MINLRTLANRMPDAIEGFFFVPQSSKEEKDKARNARQAFMAQYRLPADLGPPLLQLDLKGGGGAPFSAASLSW